MDVTKSVLGQGKHISFLCNFIFISEYKWTLFIVTAWVSLPNVIDLNKMNDSCNKNMNVKNISCVQESRQLL